MSKNTPLRKALYFAGISNTLTGIIEMVSGILSGSSSLILDALDFFFDGANYFSSIYALGKGEKLQTLFGKVKGWIMIVTGIVIFMWLIHKFLVGLVPSGEIMTVIGLLALVVNIASTLVLAKYQDNSLDLKAVWLCTRNDAINNMLIIIAGILTLRYASVYPDILVSVWMGGIAIWSGVSIIHRGESHHHHN